jgi:high-affinity nickel-transport protein
MGLHGAVWDFIGGFDLGSLGFVIVASFAIAWIVAFAFFKARRVEERWTAMVDS